MTKIIILIGLLLDFVFIWIESLKHMRIAIILKGLASFIFVMLGTIYYLNNPTPTGHFILLGLFLGMLGDIFLALRYLMRKSNKDKMYAIGILAFLLGHFCYIAALLSLNCELILACTIFFLLCILTLPTISERVTPPSKIITIFGYIYLAIVIKMFSCALGCLIVSINRQTLLFTLGAFLFMISDIFMILNAFGSQPNQFKRTTNLSTYYIGQLIIAFCISLI
ncbi:MAG: hypothetical protein HUJ56_09280 [Erysipelotrichaceae bacterium]|nr:hypothetical protein [Erysipelotrichaceae bacterium]